MRVVVKSVFDACGKLLEGFLGFSDGVHCTLKVEDAGEVSVGHSFYLRDLVCLEIFAEDDVYVGHVFELLLGERLVEEGNSGVVAVLLCVHVVLGSDEGCGHVVSFQ